MGRWRSGRRRSDGWNSNTGVDNIENLKLEQFNAGIGIDIKNTISVFFVFSNYIFVHFSRNTLIIGNSRC